MRDRYGCCFVSDCERFFKSDEAPAHVDRCPDALSMFEIGDERFHKATDESRSVLLTLKKGPDKPAELQLIKGIRDKSKILLLLESPHKKEFGKIVAPARGNTGEKIRTLSPTLLSKLCACNKCRVAIINAIQYQCSFGGDLHDKKVRKQTNERFVRLLSMATYKESFKRRLWEVYNPKVDILINCCTNGDSLCHNKDMVWGVVDEVVRMYSFSEEMMPIYSMKHPVCWGTRTAALKVSNVEESDDWHNVKFIYPCRMAVLGREVKAGCQ